jgi:hypothetical protein
MIAFSTMVDCTAHRKGRISPARTATSKIDSCRDIYGIHVDTILSYTFLVATAGAIKKRTPNYC